MASVWPAVQRNEDSGNVTRKLTPRKKLAKCVQNILPSTQAPRRACRDQHQGCPQVVFLSSGVQLRLWRLPDCGGVPGRRRCSCAAAGPQAPIFSFSSCLSELAGSRKAVRQYFGGRSRAAGGSRSANGNRVRRTTSANSETGVRNPKPPYVRQGASRQLFLDHNTKTRKHPVYEA